MSDWLQPLWDLFTPKGANQKRMDNGLVDKNNYQAFGRGHGYFNQQIKYPKTSEPNNVSTFQPVQDLGLTQIQLDAINAVQLQSEDPRTQNNTAPAWDLQNMNVQPTSPTNSSQSGFLVAIGMLFVGLIILSLFTKKRG